MFTLNTNLNSITNANINTYTNTNTKHKQQCHPRPQQSQQLIPDPQHQQSCPLQVGPEDEGLCDAVAGYIPLEYTPSSQGPAAVSKEQLMQALCDTMAALPPPAALPALLLKITSKDRCSPHPGT